MSSQGKGKLAKVILCTIVSLFTLVHLQCSAEEQKDLPGVPTEQCSKDMPNQDCDAQFDGAEAYTRPSKMEASQESGEGEHQSDKYRDFLHRSMERLEGMLEESRTQVMQKLERLMDKMAHSRDRMIEKLDAIMDSVSHSRIMQEIDHLLEEVSHSKIIEDMKSLPRELKKSLLLSVRNRSYVAAGIMVAVTMAVLAAGSLYYAWCHHDGWSISYDYRALGVNASNSVAGAENTPGQDNTQTSQSSSGSAVAELNSPRNDKSVTCGDNSNVDNEGKCVASKKSMPQNASGESVGEKSSDLTTSCINSGVAGAEDIIGVFEKKGHPRENGAAQVDEGESCVKTEHKSQDTQGDSVMQDTKLPPATEAKSESQGDLGTGNKAKPASSLENGNLRSGSAAKDHCLNQDLRNEDVVQALSGR
ncbi:hypothetical protein PoB_004709500 [Plakobranchus ocellatus]|uniref:Transmembrane protein n=1 Tax=Plakobranchus ocellatus TaxID=259542 RepID=A0AAV4BJA8_9GAST|nr:hypothetical protein PoB_004709500 [Plakobranchus ocellatus]